ncbi:hypothetical protein ACLK1S_22770 [Escherichia coli]
MTKFSWLSQAVEAPTPGMVLMLLANQDRFPLRALKFYDNDGARQEVIAEACKVILKEKAPDIAFVTTPILKWRSATLICHGAHPHQQVPIRNWMKKSHCAAVLLVRKLPEPGGIAYGMRTIGGVLELVSIWKNIHQTPRCSLLQPGSNCRRSHASSAPDAKILNICDMPIGIESRMAQILGLQKSQTDRVHYYGLNHWWSAISRSFRKG